MATWKNPSPCPSWRSVSKLFLKASAFQVFTYGEARVDFESYTASLAGQTISMNAKELEILEYLLQHEG